MPDNIRMKRIAVFFQKELARIVSLELKNPIFHNSIISFPEVRVSKDLSNAIVLVSVFGGIAPPGDIVKALNDAEPVIRRLIMDVSDLRKVPAFMFREDRLIEEAVRIESILDMLDIPPEEPEATETSDEYFDVNKDGKEDDDDELKEE